eukprot:m51a1_g10989 putative adenylate guanylate cyclase (1108) ;mRNA; f:324241-329288
MKRDAEDESVEAPGAESSIGGSSAAQSWLSLGSAHGTRFGQTPLWARMIDSSVFVSYQTMSRHLPNLVDDVIWGVDLAIVATWGTDGACYRGTAIEGAMTGIARLRDPAGKDPPLPAFAALAAAVGVYALPISFIFASVTLSDNLGMKVVGIVFTAIWCVELMHSALWYIGKQAAVFIEVYARGSGSTGKWLALYTGLVAGICVASLASTSTKLWVGIALMAGSIPFGGVGYFLSYYRTLHPDMLHSIWRTSRDIRFASSHKSPLAYDLATRYMYGLPAGSIEPNTIEGIETVLNDGMKVFPRSHYLKLCYAMFLFEIKKDRTALQMMIRKTFMDDRGSYTLMFILYCMAHSMPKSQEFTTHEEIDISKAEQHYKEARALLADFWDRLSKTRRQVNTSQLFGVVMEIHKRSHLANALYRKLLMKHPKCVMLLRSYARFLSEINDDVEQANLLYEIADNTEGTREDEAAAVPAISITRGAAESETAKEVIMESKSESSMATATSCATVDEERSRQLDLRARFSEVKPRGIDRILCALFTAFALLTGCLVAVFAVSRNITSLAELSLESTPALAESSVLLRQAASHTREARINQTALIEIASRAKSEWLVGTAFLNEEHKLRSHQQANTKAPAISGHSLRAHLVLDFVTLFVPSLLGLGILLVMLLYYPTLSFDVGKQLVYLADVGDLVRDTDGVDSLEPCIVESIQDFTTVSTELAASNAMDLWYNRPCPAALAGIMNKTCAGLVTVHQFFRESVMDYYVNNDSTPDVLLQMYPYVMAWTNESFVQFSTSARRIYDNTTQIVTWLFALTVPLSLCLWVFVLPSLDSIRESYKLANRLLLMIPISVLENCEAVSQYLESSGASAATSAKAIREEARRTMKTLLEACGDGVLVVSADESKIEMINPAAELLFEMSSETLLGGSISQLIPLDLYDEAVIQLESSGHAEKEIELQREGALSHNLYGTTYAIFLKNVTDLKAQEKALDREVVARKYAMVSVMFADIADFTTLSCKLDATELIKLLNMVFIPIDKMCSRFGVEKVKTAGDTYMAVCGIPVERDDHAVRIVEFALAILNHGERTTEKRSRQGLSPINFRIGIHSASREPEFLGEF